jgi:transcriptional regulator with XRE-family HTH domain
MTNIDPRAAAFGQRLRALRAKADWLTGKSFAEHLGWQQSKVSRIETGAQLATDADINAWFEKTGPQESEASELHDELREIRIEAASWKRQLRTGHQNRQERAGATEGRAGRIRAFEMALLPGLAQTAEYARHVLTIHAQTHGAPVDIQQAVVTRMERQRVLYEPDKVIELLITESAMRYAVCPPNVMAAQIDRLLGLAALPTVRFGIVPLGSRLPVIPMNGFWIFDESVIIETINTEITAEDPEDLDLYNGVLDKLWTIAAEEDQARKLVLDSLAYWADRAREESD